MEITGKIHVLFEQSGTFKHTFADEGYTAIDYDIENNFGETDYVVNIFNEIDNFLFQGNETIFDDMKKEDLVLAFFPCTYFCENNYLIFTAQHANMHDKTMLENLRTIEGREMKRAAYYVKLLQLCEIAEIKGLRLIVENPFSTEHYLYHNFPYKARVIYYDRRMYGDDYRKPTQFFFINCEPGNNQTIQRKCKSRSVEADNGFRRSMISRDFAKHFVIDRILSKPKKLTQLSFI